MSIWTIMAIVAGFFLGNWYAKKFGAVNLDPELQYLKDLLDQKKKAASEEAAKKKEDEAKAKVKELFKIPDQG